MGGSSAMLQPAFENEEPCLKCHVDKRGPFVFEHASVRVESHNGAGTFGRENLGVFRTPATHNLLNPTYQHCTLCHVRIHGSNSDPTFLR
jgi:hypothetical protein